MKFTLNTLRIISALIAFIIMLSGQLSIPLFGQERLPIIDMHLHADLPPHEIQAGEPSICRPEPCDGESHATANHEKH
jgi:hypothetical protein